MQELLDFLVKNGVPIDANTIIVLAFLYFGLLRWAKAKIDALSGVTEKFFAMQEAREESSRKLSSSIDNLCAAIGGRRQADFGSD